MIAAPPLLGAVHRMVADVLPAAADTPVGAAGAVAVGALTVIGCVTVPTPPWLSVTVSFAW